MFDCVVFVERPPNITIEDGLAVIAYRSGEVDFKVAMSVHTFMRSLRDAGDLFTDWRVSQAGKVERIEDWRGQAAIP